MALNGNSLIEPLKISMEVHVQYVIDKTQRELPISMATNSKDQFLRTQNVA